GARRRNAGGPRKCHGQRNQYLGATHRRRDDHSLRGAASGRPHRESGRGPCHGLRRTGAQSASRADQQRTDRGGQSHRLAHAAGPEGLVASASGTGQGGGAATVSPSSADLVLQAPAQLSATLATDRTRVSAGQALQLTLLVQNTGEADATSISPAAPTTATGTTATVDAITPISAGSVAVLH